MDEKLHSLIPLKDFKIILGVDDRSDVLSRYCFVTATYAIEQHCKRRLIRKKHTDYLTFTGEYIFSLREYPVRKVLSVYNAGILIDPKHFYCLPDEAVFEDSDLWSAPFSLVLRPPFRLSREEMAIKVRYLAGYAPGKAPADLASACLELAAWNMSRYRGQRIGITGAGRGKDEQFEPSMPENVRELLEPYRRRVL
jgi:hypothetical protein